jgi:hypothetical protein
MWSHINYWFITHYVCPSGPKEQCRKSKCLVQKLLATKNRCTDIQVQI